MEFLSIFIHSGPAVAILTALRGKYAADQNQGPVGKASRAVGRIASAAGKKVEEGHLPLKCKASVGSLFRKKKLKLQTLHQLRKSEALDDPFCFSVKAVGTKWKSWC